MQLCAWDVEVNGQDYAVSIERAENGKDVVRINGRTAAKPIGPEEDERSINVGGWPYILRRQGADKFDLEAGEAPVRSTRERDEAALGIIAGSNAPVSISHSSSSKGFPIFGWVVIVAVIAGGLYYATGPNYQKIALNRVKLILTEMHETKESPVAVSLWFKNKKNITDQLELSTAAAGFDNWCKAKDLLRQVGDFEMLESEVVQGVEPPTAIVHFKLEGKDYRVKVPKDKPISWVD